MPLINPGLGDLVDRLTILALKRRAGKAAGKDTAHFDREWAAIHTMVRTREANGKWLELALELGAVHARLWTATDEMRAIEPAAHAVKPDGTLTESLVLVAAGRLGIEILRLNDERARLVQAINELVGDHQGAEKL